MAVSDGYHLFCCWQLVTDGRLACFAACADREGMPAFVSPKRSAGTAMANSARGAGRLMRFPRLMRYGLRLTSMIITPHKWSKRLTGNCEIAKLQTVMEYGRAKIQNTAAKRVVR